ncbi:cation:proton antiporter, partial [Acinetobacter baumannii]
GGLITWFFGYSFTSACVVGACMMFSSTIIGLKLLPTTILHHQHTGEVMISILLLQDIIAIFVLTMIYGFGQGGLTLHEVVMMILGLPGLVI